jgi:hypothetical protein
MKAQECAITKQCSGCGEHKPPNEFSRTRKTRKCKTCENRASHLRYLRNREKRLQQCAEYREANKARIKRVMAKWYKKNRAHVLERCKEYTQRPGVKQRERLRQRIRYAALRDAIQAERKAFYQKNPEARQRFEKYQSEYYSKNKHRFAARRAKRRAALLRATPAWADLKAIAKVYRLAREMTLATGIRHVVDHVIPLQGRTVCGLHVENNLQVIPEKENARKWAKFG